MRAGAHHRGIVIVASKLRSALPGPPSAGGAGWRRRADRSAPTGTLRTTTGCPASYLGLSNLSAVRDPRDPDDGPSPFPDHPGPHSTAPADSAASGASRAAPRRHIRRRPAYGVTKIPHSAPKIRNGPNGTNVCRPIRLVASRTASTRPGRDQPREQPAERPHDAQHQPDPDEQLHVADPERAGPERDRRAGTAPPARRSR